MLANQFAKRLRQVAKFRLFPHGAVEAGEKVFYECIEGNFDRAEDDNGTPWAPHAPLTILLHGPHPLLILSGKMKEAATGGPGVIRRMAITKKGAVLSLGISSSVVPYYKKHQYGDRGPPKIPRRKFYYLARDDRPRVVAAMQAVARKKIRKMLTW